MYTKPNGDYSVKPTSMPSSSPWQQLSRSWKRGENPTTDMDCIDGVRTQSRISCHCQPDKARKYDVQQTLPQCKTTQVNNSPLTNYNQATSRPPVLTTSANSSRLILDSSSRSPRYHVPPKLPQHQLHRNPLSPPLEKKIAMFPNRVWSDLYASSHGKYGLSGHNIAPVQLLCLYGGKETQKLVCPYHCITN